MVNLLPFADYNLILTGYTGPNQPLIGVQVAERLRLPLMNVEEQIEERTGLSMDELRVRFGESRLKTVEMEIMEEVILRRNAVIRISGRTLMQGSHLDDLIRTGPVICLVASLDAVLRRLHLALGARYHDPGERALALGHLQQEWAIRHKPGIHELDTTYLAEADIVDAVIELWQQLVFQRG